jgi:hypothetical protein
MLPHLFGQLAHESLVWRRQSQSDVRVDLERLAPRQLIEKTPQALTTESSSP